MKRVLIVITLIVLVWFSYTVIVNGFEYEQLDFEILRYEDIKTKSEKMTKDLAVYNKKNDEEYENVLSNLNASIKKYESSKEKYEILLEEMGNDEDFMNNQQVYASQTAYDIDFLLTTLGTYGNREGVNVTLDLVKSSQTDPNAAILRYTLCDLNFTVSGEYINISHFLYDIEDDDELAFEIRDFGMTKDATTFTVYNLPINNATFIESSSSSNLNANATFNGSINSTNPTGSGATTSQTQNTTSTTNTTTTQSNAINTTNTISN